MNAVNMIHQADSINKPVKEQNVKSAIVFYYAIRNNLYLTKAYRKIFPQESRNRIKRAFKLWIRLAIKPKGSILEKANRALYMMWGIKDFLCGRMGKKV